MIQRIERFKCATLYQGDALEVFQHIAADNAAQPETSRVLFDGVITDPPYSSGGAYRGDRQASVHSKYLQSDSGNHKLAEFFGDARDQRGFTLWSALWASGALQLSNIGAPIAVFSDWRQLPESTDYLQIGGWVWRGIVPWSKPDSRPQKGRFKAGCEFIAWGSKGAMPFERGVGCLPGFFEMLSPRERTHIAEKPVELLRQIVGIVKAGGLVCDPFMGSGTTGVAALETGRNFIGCELSAAHFDDACRRIEKARPTPGLVDLEFREPEQATLEALA
jgi:site-specific DNA-methyltransferase (adenine-specific)